MATHYASPEARERDRKRKIYKRQAERFMKQAQKATGTERERYRSAARGAIESAMGTYESKSKVKGRIKQLAEQLGVNARPSEVSQYNRAMALSRADQMKASNMNANTKANVILQGVAGSRFWSATSDIWEGNIYQDREEAVIDWFKQRFDGVENLMDVLEIIEQVAPGIYDEEKPQEGKYSEESMYTDVTKTVSTFVSLG